MAFITVEATVESVFWDGKGIGLVEQYTTKDGESVEKRYTAWFTEAPGLEVGAFGVFSGTHSAKVEEYESKIDGELKRKAAVSINGAKFKQGVGQSMPQAPVEKALAQGWASPAVDAGAPF